MRFGDADRRTYAVHVTSASRSRKPSLLTRFAFDAHGDLRGGRLLAMTAVIAMFISMGTLVVVYLTNEVSPAAMAWWVGGTFVVVKVPLMAFFWWLLGTRDPNANDLDEPEAREMLIRLRQRSLTTAHHEDAQDRFEALIGEAAFVATHSPPDVERDARALIVEIEERRDEAAASAA